MADLTTEIVYVPLKPGLDLSTGETRTHWDECLGILARQPGVKRVLWGRQVEDPNMAHMIIDWDKLESHKAFMESPDYAPFLEKVGQNFLAAPPNFFHVRLPSAQMAKGDPFTSPVTELFSAFFQPDYASSDYDAQFATFQEQVAQIANTNAKGVVGGWSLENQGHEALGEGVQGKLFVMFIGWESLADHMKFRESEEFAKVIPYLREGTVARNAKHIEFVKYK